ncbi:cell wall-binding repeat-containing protein [Liberibacter phage P-PA19-1]|nr:cell wall-binding repeat-containing protein [Liberibacter phage P-PA19-1]
MVNFRKLADMIKNKVFSRGYTVDPNALAGQLAEDERRIRHYKHVYSTPEGRFVLTDLMVEGGLLSSVSNDSAHQLALLEGKRSLAVHIASNCGLSFERIVQMYSDNPRY